MKRQVGQRRGETFSILHSSFSIPRFAGGRRRNGGFTLIEMLVVIVIMVILMGVVFKLTRGAMNKSDAAKEEALVTKVRTLIEEFHAEYNIYPPVPTYRTHDGEDRQPINFRGACPDGAKTPAELRFYPVPGKGYSYAQIKNNNGVLEPCYFIFGLFSFFVDRSKYGQTAISMAGGSGGLKQVSQQWGSYNDDVEGVGGKYEISISQKDRAFAHRVWPIVAELCGGEDYENPPLKQSYDRETGYCMGYTTGIFGQWADGIGYVYSGDKKIPIYDEGLVYISKPPYTTYLLFSKGPDNQYEEPADDRTLPLNKDNIYGNLGDK